MENTSTAPPRRYPGRWWLALGFLIAVLGIAAYVGQLLTHRLTTPWYVPVAGSLGVLCALVALGQARSVWRGLALVVLLLLAGAEWAVLWGGRLPAYTGPVAVGRPLPAFTTLRADGTPFTQRDLEGGPNHVLVFFRGRW